MPIYQYYYYRHVIAEEDAEAESDPDDEPAKADPVVKEKFRSGPGPEVEAAFWTQLNIDLANYQAGDPNTDSEEDAEANAEAIADEEQTDV